MFGYSLRRFAINYLVIATAILAGVAGFSSHNSITGEFDWSRGVDNVAAIFGGAASFVAILAVGLISMVIVFSVKMAADNDDVKNIYAGLLALVFVVIAIIVGSTWIKAPSEAIWILVAFFALVTIATALVTSRSRPAPVA